MPEVDAGGSIIEYEPGDGKYACPECGTRYDSPGICDGGGKEAGHAAAQVEKVKGGKDDGAADGAGNGPTIKELRREASELGVSGYSKLPKDELAAAIAEHKAGAAA
ncbi:MAG: Rho termination factor N-terminal domain-containing protein [Candidatus Rokuibacteriota bacterium]